MLLAIDPAQPFEFVPRSQSAEPEPATFSLRPLTTVDRVELSTLSAGQDTPGMQGGALAVATVRRCLVGWKNVQGRDGKPLALERDWHGVTRECLAQIPTTIILEIAGELLKREAVTQDEAGKS